MGREYSKFNDQNGTTVVEVMVVVLIISILAAMALMQRGSANEQFQRQNVARELKVAFERARFDSVKRRAQHPGSFTADTRARVVIDANSYTLVTDKNGNSDLVNDDGSFDSADAMTTAVGTNIVIAGSGITLPVTVLFDQRGEVTAESSSGSNPIFLVCNVSCSNPSAANSNIVLVTPSGTVNLLAGGSALPTFGAPTVTSISNTTGVNPDVVLP